MPWKVARPSIKRLITLWITPPQAVRFSGVSALQKYSLDFSLVAQRMTHSHGAQPSIFNLQHFKSIMPNAVSFAYNSFQHKKQIILARSVQSKVESEGNRVKNGLEILAPTYRCRSEIVQMRFSENPVAHVVLGAASWTAFGEVTGLEIFGSQLRHGCANRRPFVLQTDGFQQFRLPKYQKTHCAF